MNHSMRPWRRALCWLAFLGPFFYLTYGIANHVASLRTDVPALVFEWERQIPFWAWTIFPYWSINLFYAASPFLCRTRHELDRHALRLLTAQIVAISCFLLWPLQFTFGQPPADGLAGALFAGLRAFDKSFNQAPSLHIALAVILWDCYRRWLRTAWARRLLAAWMLVICASVLTTYQHHFIDIPTGALLGFFCVWLWPLERQAGPAAVRARADAGHPKLAGVYAAGALLMGVAATAIGGWGLWLWWPVVSLMLVAANYMVWGARGFQVSKGGSMSVSAYVLYAPYLAGVWINSRLWTWRLAPAVEVLPGVWLGRTPARSDAGCGRWSDVVAMSPELPPPARSGVTLVPVLDLTVPSSNSLRRAVAAIDASYRQGQPLLVCCALGFSRSAAALAAWLVHSKKSGSIDDAIELLRAARPQLVLGQAHVGAIARCGSQRTPLT